MGDGALLYSLSFENTQKFKLLDGDYFHGVLYGSYRIYGVCEPCGFYADYNAFRQLVFSAKRPGQFSRRGNCGFDGNKSVFFGERVAAVVFQLNTRNFASF